MRMWVGHPKNWESSFPNTKKEFSKKYELRQFLGQWVKVLPQSPSLKVGHWKRYIAVLGAMRKWWEVTQSTHELAHIYILGQNQVLSLGIDSLQFLSCPNVGFIKWLLGQSRRLGRWEVGWAVKGSCSLACCRASHIVHQPCRGWRPAQVDSRSVAICG